MESTILEIVPLQNSLAEHSISENIKKKVLAKISETVPNASNLKGDLEILKYILTLVINLSNGKKLSKQDIESIIARILIDIFNYNSEELKSIFQYHIPFLFKNKLVRKYNIVELYIYNLWNYAKKKFS
jgi:hypothetical protein